MTCDCDYDEDCDCDRYEEGYKDGRRFVSQQESPGVPFAKKKIMDLQDQLIKHYKGEQILSNTDVIRYDAMCEVLKQVIQ